MSQLSLLDERLQAELARPAHWVEPPSKIRGPRVEPKVDYEAWLEHADDCAPCMEARDEPARLRARHGGWEPVAPCPVGLRLLPTVDVDLASPELNRVEAGRMLVRLLAEAQRLRGCGQ